MDDDSLFTENFFSYFNTDLDIDILRRESQEVDNLIKERLYATSKETPLYYAGPYYDYEALRTDISYSVLQKQLIFTIDYIKKWGIEQNIPNLASLTEFSERLINLSNIKINRFYADEKKKLEAMAVLLVDNDIDLLLRKKILIQILANDGLAQCIDNCYFLINNAYNQLISLKNGKKEIYHLVRNYVTDIARDTAASRPFALPKSFQETFCEIKKLPIFSHESHAANHFLSLAKENHFPVNTVDDVIALNMASTPNHFIINREYIAALKKNFNANDFINYLNVEYHNELMSLWSDNSIDYHEKIIFLSSKLAVLGQDDRFFLYDFLDNEGNLKNVARFKQTIITRLINKGWIVKPYELIVKINHKPYRYIEFRKNIELSWLNWNNAEDVAESCTMLDLINTNKLVGLDQTTRSDLINNLLNKAYFINDLKVLKDILDKAEFDAVKIFFSADKIVRLIKTNADIDLISAIFSKLPREKAEDVIKLLSVNDKKVLLEKGFSKANVQIRYSALQRDYLLENANQDSKQDALKITKYIIQLFLTNDFVDFSKLNFPRLASINYLDNHGFSNVDFSDCAIEQPLKNTLFNKANLRNTHFYQRVNQCWFENSLLENTVFHRELADISFLNADLRKTVFANGASFLYFGIDLTNAQLSTNSFKHLLDASVREFTKANLNAVNFQEIKEIERLRLDFSGANLKGADFHDLNLNKIKFYGCNLQESNLKRSIFNLASIDKNIQLEGAKLGIPTLEYFSRIGITQFKRCEIYQEINMIDVDSFFYFEHADFREAKFVGNLFYLQMIACNLEQAKFISATYQEADNHLMFIHFKGTRFVNTEFHSITFKEVTFANCLFKEVIFTEIKMSANTLFNLYQQGHRDFNGVKEAKGKLPIKLPPFPLYEASLSKEVFKDFYDLGVRDFRASNLKSFYLGETLISQKISEIELKLEGAAYKPFLLGCKRRHAQTKRSIGSAASMVYARCSFHFIVIKKSLEEKVISFKDIWQLALALETEKHSAFIREVSLAYPLLLLNHPDEINFYWAYQPDNEDYFKVITYTKGITKPLQREKIEINFNFLKKYQKNTAVEAFANELYLIGFRRGQLNHYDTLGNVIAVDLKLKPVKFLPKLDFKDKFSSILNPTEDDSIPKLSKALNKKTQRSRLYRIAVEMKKQARNVLHSGLRQGAHYELGYALMYLISTWITHANAPEPKDLDNNTKAALKNYASAILEQEADKKRASTYQRQLVLNIAEQCIDRGECSDKTLVHTDIIDTLNTLKSDAQVGYELIWEKTKGFFVNVGKYLAEKFTSVKEAFQAVSRNRLENPNQRKWRPPLLFRKRSDFIISNNSGTESNTSLHWVHGPHRPFLLDSRLTEDKSPQFNESLSCELMGSLKFVSKRKIDYWYEHPILIALLKDIELLFNELDYDLNLDPNFSDSKLAGFLYDFWLTLDKYNVSSDLSLLEPLLNLFENEAFFQDFFNSTYLDKTEFLLNNTAAENEDLESLAYFNMTESDIEDVILDRKERSTPKKNNPQWIFDKEYNFQSYYYDENEELIQMLTSKAQRPMGYLNIFLGYITGPFRLIRNLIFQRFESSAIYFNPDSIADRFNKPSGNISMFNEPKSLSLSREIAPEYPALNFFIHPNRSRFKLNNRQFIPDSIDNSAINDFLVSANFFAKVFFSKKNKCSKPDSKKLIGLFERRSNLSLPYVSMKLDRKNMKKNS